MKRFSFCLRGAGSVLSVNPRTRLGRAAGLVRRLRLGLDWTLRPPNKLMNISRYLNYTKALYSCWSYPS